MFGSVFGSVTVLVLQSLRVLLKAARAWPPSELLWFLFYSSSVYKASPPPSPPRSLYEAGPDFIRGWAPGEPGPCKELLRSSACCEAWLPSASRGGGDEGLSVWQLAAAAHQPATARVPQLSLITVINRDL